MRVRVPPSAPLLALLLPAVLLLGACAREHRARPLDTLVRLSDDEAKGLDPQRISDLTSLRVADDQFEGLMRHRGDGGVEPGLAQPLGCTPDRLVCQFRLLQGLRFSDRAPITARTFADGFARLRDPATAAPQLRLFDAIAAVTAPAPDLVEVRLVRPTPYLGELLAQPAMAALPLHRIRAAGERWTAERPLVTSGAYRLTEWRLGDRIVLERNSAWHDPPAPSARIVWQPVEDKLAALRRFTAGDADTVSDVPPTRVGWIGERLPGTLHIAPYAGTYYLAFNTRRAPFADPRVRQALSMAVDRAWIARRLLATGETPALGLVPPALGGRDPDVFATPDHPAAIRGLLAAAGYGPGHPLVFDIRFNSGGDHRRIAVALAAMWRPYGVEAHLLNSEAALHFAALRQGDFQLARSGWIADLPAAENFLGVHRRDAGPVNYSGRADAAYDRLLDTALADPDPARRAALLAQAEERLLRSATILPIFHYVSRSLVALEVAGWQDNVMNIHPSRLLYRRPR